MSGLSPVISLGSEVFCPTELSLSGRFLFCASFSVKSKLEFEIVDSTQNGMQIKF